MCVQFVKNSCANSHCILHPASNTTYNSWQVCCRTSTHKNIYNVHLAFENIPYVCLFGRLYTVTWHCCHFLTNFILRSPMALRKVSEAFLKSCADVSLQKGMLLLLRNWCRLLWVLQYWEFVWPSHTYITNSHMRSHRYAEDCEKPAQFAPKQTTWTCSTCVGLVHTKVKMVNDY